MIPKIIHYIWFGGNPYPEKIQYCIESWKKRLPEYEFKLWNEETFDVNSVPFTREAYENRKWAFVSDYVRVWALHKYGGVYLDTDIEVIKPLDKFLGHRLVLGTDEEGHLTALMASEAGHPYWEKILDMYANLSFEQQDGTLNFTVNNFYLEQLLEAYGYRVANVRQTLREGIEIYPDDYFHGVSLMNGKEHRTSNTHAIHWHTLTWCGKKTHVQRFLRVKLLKRIIGGEAAANLAVTFHKLIHGRK